MMPETSFLEMKRIILTFKRVRLIERYLIEWSFNLKEPFLVLKGVAEINQFFLDEHFNVYTEPFMVQ